MIGETKRSELEARVYSRAGARDPREEHVDPVSGRRLWASDSEWQLLQLQDDLSNRNRRTLVDRTTMAARSVTDTPAPSGNIGSSGRDGRAPSRGRRRRRSERRVVSAPVAALAGVLAGAALVAAWSWTDGALLRSPSVRIEVTPHPASDAYSWHAPPDAAFDLFRDPDRSSGSLPGWLTDLFPRSRIAQLVGPAGRLRGAGVYAAVSDSAIACLVVRLGANGMVWNCTSLEQISDDGMTLRTPIPAGLAAGRDDDGDGVAGDAMRSDLLVVEWHADGTFLIEHSPR